MKFQNVSPTKEFKFKLESQINTAENRKELKQKKKRKRPVDRSPLGQPNKPAWANLPVR
jgi:hypothetical protein